MPFSRSPQITLSDTVELAGTVTVRCTSESARSCVWPSAVSRRIDMQRTESSTVVASTVASTVKRRPFPAGSEPRGRAGAAVKAARPARRGTGRCDEFPQRKPIGAEVWHMPCNYLFAGKAMAD